MKCNALWLPALLVAAALPFAACDSTPKADPAHTPAAPQAAEPAPTTAEMLVGNWSVATLTLLPNLEAAKKLNAEKALAVGEKALKGALYTFNADKTYKYDLAATAGKENKGGETGTYSIAPDEKSVSFTGKVGDGGKESTRMMELGRITDSLVQFYAPGNFYILTLRKQR